MKAEVTPGQISDDRGHDALTDNDLPQPKVLMADRGYDSDHIRDDVEQRGGTPIIPSRKHRKNPKPIDDLLYALQNLVERCINKLKTARRVANRYEKNRYKLSRVNRTRIRPTLVPTSVIMT